MLRVELKSSILFLTALLLGGCSYTTDIIADRYLFPVNSSRSPSFSVSETTAELETSDGVTLRADIYQPKGVNKAPIVLVRIPLTETLGNELRAKFIARFWARRGYVAIIQGTRGRFGSTGKFYPLIHERSDGIETLKWIRTLPWYDGRVVMWGGSSFGHTQWAIADQESPGLQAMFVQIASTSFRRMFYPGGAFSLESALYWTIRSRGEKDRTVNINNLLKGAHKLPILEADDEAIGDTDFFNDWVLKREDNDYWEKNDGEHRTTTLNAPVLLLGGWFDPFLPTQIEDFKNIKAKAAPNVASETRLIIGPWAHAQAVSLPKDGFSLPYRVESLLPSIPWYDHILGVSLSPFEMSPVKIFVMGENRWRSENEWPLHRTVYTPFYICSQGKANTAQGNGHLSAQQCSSREVYDQYVYDPLDPVPTAGGAMLSTRAGIQLQNEIENRSDVLVYTTPELSESMEITGPIRAVFYVATDRPSTDFTAKLVDVHPDGSAYNLSDGILRQSYHNHAPTRIEIELWPTCNVFFKGHKIRLEVSSSNFPRYDRNLNTVDFTPLSRSTAPANQKIFHSSKYPSQIILPVIP